MLECGDEVLGTECFSFLSPNESVQTSPFLSHPTTELTTKSFLLCPDECLPRLYELLYASFGEVESSLVGVCLEMLVLELLRFIRMALVVILGFFTTVLTAQSSLLASYRSLSDPSVCS